MSFSDAIIFGQKRIVSRHIKPAFSFHFSRLFLVFLGLGLNSHASEKKTPSFGAPKSAHSGEGILPKTGGFLTVFLIFLRPGVDESIELSFALLTSRSKISLLFELFA